MNKKVLTFVILGTLTATMTGCGDNASKITDYIEQFDFKSAYEYYTENVAESKKKDEIDDEIENAMNNIYDSLIKKCADGEFDRVSFNWLTNLASEASFDDSSGYADFLYSRELISSSANAYEDGMSEYEKGNYTYAISSFEKVDEIDSAHYSDALDKISECEKLLEEQQKEEQEKQKEEISKLISDKKYSEAKQAILSLSYTDSVSSEKLLNELQNVILSDTDNKINDYFSAFDYNGAYEYVNNMYKDYELEGLKSKLENLENEFVNYSLSTAEEDAANNNYEAASAIIQQAMNNVGEDNESLVSAYNEYRSHLPVYITDMEYMSCVNSVHKAGQLKDNIGNMYHNGIYMCEYSHGGEGSAEYYIQEKYKTFSGTVAVPSGNESTDRTAYFEVYGDGNLLYTSSLMGKTSFPENFEIDVTGVKVLKISYPASNEEAWMATIYDGLLTPKSEETEE